MVVRSGPVAKGIDIQLKSTLINLLTDWNPS